MTQASIQTPQTLPNLAVFTLRSIGDDLALYVSDAEIYVSSKSKPNGFRVVNIIDNSCSCPAGAHGLDHCHHRTTAQTAAQIDRNEARPVPPQMYPSTCPPTKEAWLPESQVNEHGLVWAGYRRGWVETEAL